MTVPTVITLKNNCAIILRRTLLTSIPEEGCALLIGKIEPLVIHNNELCWQIHLIWPCSNIWEPRIDDLFEIKENLKNQSQNTIRTKRNRFAIDAREQIHAQRWARYRRMQVLGTAHSHPQGEAIPSLIDLSHFSEEQLILIVDRLGEIRPWWLTNNQNYKPIKLDINMSKENKMNHDVG